MQRAHRSAGILAMMEIYENILETMGDTPLVKLRNFEPNGPLIAAKIESFNPGSSVKDRIGPAMIEAGEKAGLLKPGGTIVEPTSGNTGLGLAMCAALKGYKMICTAPDKVPSEKVALLKAFGVEVILCPTEVEADDPRSYYKVAERIRDEQGAYLPYQYYNMANPQAHFDTTGPEIWRQTDGQITHWVAGVGTGGTISGTAKFLKERNPGLQVVGVDTVGSIYAYYFEHREVPPTDQIHQYLIDGIGEDFMPETVLWDYIDEIITIDDKTGYMATMELAHNEAIFAGSSGGAAAAGARVVARRVAAGDDPSGVSVEDALIVTLLPDSGERYLSKLNEDWLRKHDLLD
jgi:cystathionine beta-synthase|tara:strand:- start:24300 stop:25343 length:1044 start_codon:yes stop_codon:yes gene_type:complete